MLDNEKDKEINELIAKQLDESPTAYSAFLFYAQIPSNVRSKQGTPRTANYSGLTEATVKHYRTIYRWDERVNMLDAYFYKQEMEKRSELMKESRLKYAEDTKIIQDEAIKASKKAINVVNMLLEKAELSGTVKEGKWVNALQPDGSHKSVPTETTFIMKAELRDAAPLLKEAVRVPLIAAGLPTDAGNYNQAVAKADLHTPLGEKTLEELEAEAVKIAEALESQELLGNM